MPSKKKIKEAMTILVGELHVDRMLTKKDGTFELRWGFFYRHGGSAEKKKARVEEVISHVRVVDWREHWNIWPKDSYWSVIVEVTDPDSLVEQAQDVCAKYTKAGDHLDAIWSELVQEARNVWKYN